MGEPYEPDLESLDARADAVAAALSDDDDVDYVQSQEGESSSYGSSETAGERGAAAAAAFVPEKRRRDHSEQQYSRRRSHELGDRNLEEDDGILRAASWRDLEDTRKFLESDHRERFDVLISRWEGVEDGDDVDLNTGRIVHSMGHLDALAPQRNLAFFGESDDDDDDDDDDGDDDDDRDSRIAGGPGNDGRHNEYDGGIDPLYTVCQKPSPLLDMIVTSLQC